MLCQLIGHLSRTPQGIVGRIDRSSQLAQLLNHHFAVGGILSDQTAEGGDGASVQFQFLLHGGNEGVQFLRIAFQNGTCGFVPGLCQPEGDMGEFGDGGFVRIGRVDEGHDLTRLGLGGCRIALLGGLLSSENPYQEAVIQALSAIGTPLSPAHDALWGAAQMAWEQL